MEDLFQSTLDLFCFQDGELEKKRRNEMVRSILLSMDDTRWCRDIVSRWSGLLINSTRPRPWGLSLHLIVVSTSGLQDTNSNRRENALLLAPFNLDQSIEKPLCKHSKSSARRTFFQDLKKNVQRSKYSPLKNGCDEALIRAMLYCVQLTSVRVKAVYRWLEYFFFIKRT